jgi:hypothetical protein
MLTSAFCLRNHKVLLGVLLLADALMAKKGECWRAGKTLAFGLPALRHIQKQRSAGVVTGKGPFFLCLAPTRELAQQIGKVLEDASCQCGLRCCVVYGGVPKQPQAKALRHGAEMAVGTPGRILDLMQDGALDFSVCSQPLRLDGPGASVMSICMFVMSGVVAR